MAYTLDEKITLINEQIKSIKSKNPIEIAELFMDCDFVSIHGPEHHYLDGAAFLTAYGNASGKLELNEALDELRNRTLKMPGAMCGLWGVCGSTAAIGACLSIINGTGPLSDDRFYKDNMEFTSKVISQMSVIGGPRCCKRNAFISIMSGVDFVAEKYGVPMEKPVSHKCKYSKRNHQCIKERCPFYKD